MRVILVKNGIVENIISADSKSNKACEGFDHVEDESKIGHIVKIGASYDYNSGVYTNPPEPESE